MKRVLRVSAYKDYVAVDILDKENKVLSTPFYLRYQGMQTIKYKDNDGISRITNVFLKSDGHEVKLLCRDNEMTDWEMPIDELTDSKIVTEFLN